MAYPTYTPAMLANFTGRPVESYPEPYTSASVFPQATLLFKMGTCIADPALLSTEEQQLIDFAILSMSDAIVLAAPYAEALASPFSSESIGSYSYSKAASAVQQGDATGIMWFDTAVDRLGVCNFSDGLAMSGGIEIFEYQGNFTRGRKGANVAYLTPGDMASSRRFGYDPSTGIASPIFVLGGNGSGTGGGPGDGETAEDWLEDPQYPGLYFPDED